MCFFDWSIMFESEDSIKFDFVNLLQRSLLEFSGHMAVLVDFTICLLSCDQDMQIRKKSDTLLLSW